MMLYEDDVIWMKQLDERTYTVQVSRQRAHKLVKEMKRAAKKSGCSCSWCGRNLTNMSDMEVDHEIPVVIGGPHKITNLQILCYSCHKNKTNIDKGFLAALRSMRYMVKRGTYCWAYRIHPHIIHEMYKTQFKNMLKARGINQ